jgi:hypothetical protein
MTELATKPFADMPDISPDERKALIEEVKLEYSRILETICPSKDIRALAKRISKRKCPCDKCVYPLGNLCMFPRSDGYIEDLGIDPCYEGVLRFLRKEMGGSDDGGEAKKLRDDLIEAHDIVCAALEASIIIANMFDAFMGENPKTQKHTAAIVGRIRDDMRELLNKVIARRERI